MGRSRFKVHENHYPYFLTSSIVDGISLFADMDISNICIDALSYLQSNNSTTLYGYVLMHNHLHLVIEADDVPNIIRRFKSFTARKIIDTLKAKNQLYYLRKLETRKHDHHKDSNYQVWQEGYHPKQIFTSEIMVQKLAYMHNNPVVAGFIDKPGDWRCSSARNYLGLKAVIPITLFSG
ncbi:MAG: transposase [bacterium]|nr:transposase [bacterium]